MSGLLIISNNNLALFEDENVGKFSDLYVGWLDGIYKNAQVLTGNVVGMEWVP